MLVLDDAVDALARFLVGEGEAGGYAFTHNERRLTLQREALLMAAESRDVEAVFLSAPNALDIAPLVDAIVAMARAPSRALQIVVHGYRVPARRGVLAGSAF